MLITCVKRGSIEVVFSILNDLKSQKIDIKPSAFRIAFDTAAGAWNLPLANRV